MKYVYLAILATFFSVVSIDAKAQEINPYIGAYGGYAMTETEIEDTPTSEPDGFDYGVFVGVKVDNILKSAGLGLTGAIEVHYGASGADDTVNDAGTPVTVEKGSEFGISFRPGLSLGQISEVLNINPYGILGYKNTEFEITSPATTVERDFNGFELGIGTQLMAYDNYLVRLEYAHTFYGDKDGFDPSEDTVRLGVAYQF